MSYWYRQVVDDPNDFSPLVNAIMYFEKELKDADNEVILSGLIEKASAKLSGITALRFGQLQEVEAILKYFNIRYDQAKNNSFKKYLTSHNRALSSRDAERYAESDENVVEIALLINQIALVRNRYLSVMKGLETMNWQIGNITKLRCAGMEDTEV